MYRRVRFETRLCACLGMIRGGNEFLNGMGKERTAKEIG